jgi:hypothetical protein
VELVPYEPGELVPAFSIVDAVREGKVPAGYTWLGYDQGKIPASALIAAVPFGMEPWEFSAWWYEADGRALTERLYHADGVHPIYCGIIGPETAGWFRKPIDTIEDLRGLKIRFAGLGGKVLERLGASVTMLPGGEIFQALEKGAIDATEYSLPVVDEALGFDRVASINYFPGWHQTYTSFHLVVNLAIWDGLAAADRALLDTACTAGVTRNLARSEGLQGAVASNCQQGVGRACLRPSCSNLHRHRRSTRGRGIRDENFREILTAARLSRGIRTGDASPIFRWRRDAARHTLVPAIDRTSPATGWRGRLVLLGVIVLNVVLRYAFGQAASSSKRSSGIYAIGMLLGLSIYADDTHIQVDVFPNARPRLRAWIELYGSCCCCRSWPSSSSTASRSS